MRGIIIDFRRHILCKKKVVPFELSIKVYSRDRYKHPTYRIFLEYLNGRWIHTRTHVRSVPSTWKKVLPRSPFVRLFSIDDTWRGVFLLSNLLVILSKSFHGTIRLHLVYTGDLFSRQSSFLIIIVGRARSSTLRQRKTGYQSKITSKGS